MFKYLISLRPQMCILAKDFIFISFVRLKNGLCKPLLPLLWNEKTEMFPSSRAVDSSPLVINAIHVRIQRGDMGSGPDPQPWTITKNMEFYRN